MDVRTKIGRIGLAYAIKHYTDCDFTVSIPLDDTQWYDLIIEKDGITEFIQCRATQTKNNVIDLRSTGGTVGEAYDHIFNHPISRLFCVDSANQMFDIPVLDLKDYNPNMLSFKLNTIPSENNQGFPSYKYRVNK